MPRRVDDRLRLLHGPYQPPRLRVGDRATCLFRDCDVIVTSWTDAPISWPRSKASTRFWRDWPRKTGPGFAKPWWKSTAGRRRPAPS